MNNPKEVVLKFLKAMNEEDFATARSCVSDDLSFKGVLGARDGAEAYFKDMERMRLKYEVKKVFVDGDDICVLYDINFSNPQATVFTCGWYHVDSEKIDLIKVVFDPRPLLQQK